MHPIARFALAVLVVTPATLGAQRNALTLDVSLPGLAVGYAVPTGGGGRLLGVQLGIGGDWINRTLDGPSHFTENGGEQMLELGHLAVFLRQHVGTRGSVDVGLRILPFIHGTNLDNNAGLAGFAGAYVTPMVHWGRFAVGPRILAGYFTEGSNAQGFGVNVAPLVGRVTFGR